jgi:hypothetical protein
MQRTDCRLTRVLFVSSISGYLPHAPPVVTDRTLALARLRSLGPMPFRVGLTASLLSLLWLRRGKAVWLGEVEAPDESAAMEKAAEEYKVGAKRLIAFRR